VIEWLKLGLVGWKHRVQTIASVDLIEILEFLVAIQYSQVSSKRMQVPQHLLLRVLRERVFFLEESALELWSLGYLVESKNRRLNS